MKRSILISTVFALVLIASQATTQKAALQTGPEQAMITTYCAGCHNSKAAKPAGGLALDNQNVQAPSEHPEVWEKAIRKLRGRLMPPPGAKQPEQKEIDSFIGYLENSLDTHAAGPKAGYVGIHRMSRTEYAAAVKALVGVDVTARDVLPADVAVDGFDNIAAA